MSDDNDDTAQVLKLDLPVAPTVLIVDDDELVLAKLEEIVASAGYSVRTAHGGADAMRFLEDGSASVVVTDLKMPGMDGLELCRLIRGREWPGYIYIVLLTVQDEEEDILAGFEAGADDYVSKRTSKAQLMARLRTAKRILSLEHCLKIALENKRQLAMTDPLTGVFNRRYLVRHLGRELNRSQRFGGDVSLMMLDVDHFKRINDTFGHLVGDSALKQLTAKIAECLRRATDWCARIGGDEFVVVLEGANVEEARRCAEKVRQTVSGMSIDTPRGPVNITISIGISGLERFADKQSVTVQSLLDQADTSLYASKICGRNRVTLSDSNTPSSAREPADRRPTHASFVPVSSIR